MGAVRNINIVTEGGYSNLKLKAKIFAIVIIFLLAGCAYSENLVDSNLLKMRKVDEMDMSGIMLNYAGDGSFVESDTPDFNLPRMKRMNPNFTDKPEALGIIWLKHVAISRAPDGGIEVTRLYVILGRQGLSRMWLTWNIPVPARGSVDILESDVYDFDSLARITTVDPDDQANSGVRTLNFVGLPNNFILVVSWRENLPEQLLLSGLCWFQEDLPVWESVVEVNTPQEIDYKTFPAVYVPEITKLKDETEYIWRRVNVAPYISEGELARFQRQGVVFSPKERESGFAAVLKDIENIGVLASPAEVRSSPTRVIEWLKRCPEIELAEGAPRKIPPNLHSQKVALTKREKLLLAKSWLNAQKVDAGLVWQLPFEPDSKSPLCPEMFYSPVLEVRGVSGISFEDMRSLALLAGSKIYYINPDTERIGSRRIPSSKAADNTLNAKMNLKLDTNGILNGNVKISLGGAWQEFLLKGKTDAGTLRGAILTLFPGLKDFMDIKYSVKKDVPEISFNVVNQAGVAGTGKGILAVIPFFEPVAMRKLGTYESPIEIVFPFVVEQELTIAFPKNVKESLLSTKVNKSSEKINYSHNYMNRRHRLEAKAAIEVGVQTVRTGDVPTLLNCLESWRAFSARNIPVR